MNDVIIERRAPTVEEYCYLRSEVGWNDVKPEIAKEGLRNSLFLVCARINDKIIGCGRINGDRGLAYYIEDIIVIPQYQGRGIGAMIMNEIVNYLDENCPDEAFVCLMSAKGKEGFYKKFGFIERPNENYGAGMYQYYKKNKY